MYLKQLGLIGFKSFAERTRLDFGSGITAIVGPNGCGKTNIVESIRWAIGEQSAKSLRSSGMEDVIFHGTDDRRGIGMAEVSVTFDNSDKHLPLEFGEVTVTRRGFRSGESHYFVNKNICRLRDVDSIFMDTGIGMSAYSIFEQGRIDLILSSKPEERRFVFEEAAGITNYKERKRETLHKLEITEQNLVRLNDIIKELQRQLNSIERQAAKARRYKKIQEELKAQEARLLVYQLGDLQKKSLEFEKDKLFTEQTAIQLRERINAKELRIGEFRTIIQGLDSEIAQIQDEKLLVETQLVSNKHEIQYKNNKIDELKHRNGSIDNEIERVNKDLANLHNTLNTLLKGLGDAQDIRIGYKNRLEEKNDLVKSLDERCKELNKEVEIKKDLLLGKTARQLHIKNEINAIELELKTLYLKQRRDSVEIAKKEAGKEKLLGELRKMEGVLSVQKESVLNIRQSIRDNEEKVILLKDEVRGINKTLRDKQEYFAERRSEYEIFSNQKKLLEGYPDGIKIIMENTDEFPGFIGIVNDLVSVPKEYFNAIGSVLGVKAQWVVMDTLVNACNAGTLLHDKGASQTVFLVLELLGDGDLIQDKGVGVRAVDVVRYDKRYEKLVRFLLGRVLVVKGLDDIKGLAEQKPTDSILVTDTGIVLDYNGVVIGGKFTGGVANLVQRDASISELKVILNNVSSEILELMEKQNLCEEKLLQEEIQLESAKNNMYNEEIALSIQENDFLGHKQEYDSLCEEIQVLRLTEQEESLKKEEFGGNKIEKEKELIIISDELEFISSEIGKNSRLLKDINDKMQRLEREYTELKICLVSAEEKENLLEFKKTECQKQIDANLNNINTSSSEKTENICLIEKLTKEVVKLEEEVSGLSQRSISIEQRYGTIKNRHIEIELELAKDQEVLRKERQETDGIYSQLNERQLALAEIRLKIDNIIQKLQDEYKMTMEEINNISPEGVDIDILEQDIIRLKDKLDSMGEVSLVAITQQDELIERYEFLNTQREDLVNAKETLLKTIAKLNTTTKKLFWDTFCQIRGNFNNIFCQLFGGGKADLVLIDEQDILESGIEIIARPPGKKLQNVSLLSGGEKALTAIALLFSIFKVKPSPFCIMDEIDAPLDDSNIDRFVELLKEFAKISQFIIITHNKRTISAADALYGITMEESGVSKVVSVRFNVSSAVG